MNLLDELENGTILPVYKPLDWTSFDVVKKIKGLTRKSVSKLKIGHAGTLDPLAEGLLIICTQKMTKQVDAIHALPKTYIATIFLGAERPSYDKETEISATYPIDHIDEKLVSDTLKSFMGKQEQIPPVYSAVKQDGKRLFLKARKGIEVEVKPKEIEVYDIRLIEFNLPLIKVEVRVSKGTYIRTLAFDIGKRLNSGAYLDHLVRSKVGDYSIEHSLDMETIHKTLATKE
ncbi:MAG: tRNA pseudouridine(55) synthase TruB [Chitinophagales bacterium]|nr:tRNA pseudouridine(55) synthase TruB [Chitinophagales bacterium]